MSGRTPGPWRISHHNRLSRDGYAGISGANHDYLAEVVIRMVDDKLPTPELLANARLIAAAPDLLEALQMLYSETADYIRLNNLGGIDNQCMQLSRAAIAKATAQPAGEGEK